MYGWLEMVALAITFRRLTGKPLSRLTYIASKVGRGSRRLYWNGTERRCAAASSVEFFFFCVAIKRLETFSCFFFLFFWSCTPHANTFLAHTRSRIQHEWKKNALSMLSRERCWKRRKRKKKNEAANLVSSVLSPITETTWKTDFFFV